MIIYVYDANTVMRDNNEILDGWANVEGGYSYFDPELLFAEYLCENFDHIDVFNMDEGERTDVKIDFLNSVYEKITHWLNNECQKVEISSLLGCETFSKGDIERTFI